MREARLLESNEVIRQNFDKQAYAAVIAEALYKTIRPEIPLPHAFDMTRVALGALRKSSASFACAIGAAHLLKLVAYLGVRPNLSTCVSCGAPVPLDNPLAVVHVSVSDGGLVCANCNAHLDTVSMNANSLGWARFLLQATFAQIIETPVPAGIDSQTLQFAHLWLKAHMGVSLKSVGFALAYAEMGRGTDAIRP